MKAKKNLTAVNESKYNAAVFIETAKKSGSALRTITAKNGGVYPVDYEGTKKTGTPIVIAFLYRLAGGKKDGSVSADKISDLLSGFDFSSENGKKLNALLPKNYGNFNTLRSRILGEIRKGAILSFSPVKK